MRYGPIWRASWAAKTRDPATRNALWSAWCALRHSIAEALDLGLPDIARQEARDSRQLIRAYGVRISRGPRVGRQS
jgi:hypothetical protein